MYFLVLNMIRDRFENTQVVAHADTEQELLDLINRESVPRYTDTWMEFGESKNYHKSFRKDGPLEWYNPPRYVEGILIAGMEQPAILNYGTREEYMEKAGAHWDALRAKHPSANSL